MKKLLIPLLIFAAMLGGGIASSQLAAQVTYSPQQSTVKRGTVDPTAGAGVTAIEGTLYVRTGATDALYQKTGSAATAWTQVALAGGAGSFSDITATGRITGAGFTSSIDGSAGTPAYNWSANAGLGAFRSASNLMGWSANGVMYANLGVLELATVGGAGLTVGQAADFRGNIIGNAPRTATISGVGSTVSPNGNWTVLLAVNAGGVVSTAAPFIIDGSDGQRVRLINTDAADALTLANDGGTATNLRLRAATRVLAANGGWLELEFLTATGLWQETGFD